MADPIDQRLSRTNTASSQTPNPRRGRTDTNSSIQNINESVRSTTKNLLDSNVPLGMWAATAALTSKAPTVGDIRRGSFSHGGWDDPEAQQSRRRGSMSGSDRPNPIRRTSSGMSSEKARISRQNTLSGYSGNNDIEEEEIGQVSAARGAAEPTSLPAVREAPSRLTTQETGRQVEPFEEPLADKRLARTSTARNSVRDEDGEISDGYITPPKKPWAEASWIGFKGFVKWVCTPAGFLITVYGLNVVAWGGMLFLLLCGAAPTMCKPNTPENHFDGCNDINSARKIWLEIDSQILNALFCVTGFGLIPWRFRDLYWLLRWRFCSEKKKGHAAKMYPLRRLAGINNNWFRLPGSDTLDELSTAAYQESIGIQPLESFTPEIKKEGDVGSGETDGSLNARLEADERIPLPIAKRPNDPLTDVRAPPTALWLLDFAIWGNVWNTFFQVCLCGFMWGMNRYNRPSWATGLFIVIGCCSAGAAGIMMFTEGKKVKRVEGVPVQVAEKYNDIEMQGKQGETMKKESLGVYDHRQREEVVQDKV